MKSWKRKTRAQHKAIYRITLKAKNPRKHLSKWGMRRWGRQYVSPHQAWGSKIYRDKYFLKRKLNRKMIDTALVCFAKYPYIEDCRYHPCRVTKLEHDYDMGRVDFECESIVNGSPNACSYFHCGIIFLTEEEGQERAEFIKKYGMVPYQIQYIQGTPTSKEQLTKYLRYSRGMERNWDFSKNSRVEEVTEDGKAWFQVNHDIIWDDIVPMTDEEMREAWDD